MTPDPPTPDVPAGAEPANGPTGSARPLPPVLGRLLSGTFWLALRTPLQVLFAFWSIPLILEYVGEDNFGAFGFAWGFGFLQFLLEFGMSSALNRQISDRWTRGDRDGVNRMIATGMRFYMAMALLQATVLLSIATFGIPDNFDSAQHDLIIRLLWMQALTAPCFGVSTVVSCVLQAARKYDFIPRIELAILVIRFLVLWGGLQAGISFFLILATQTFITVSFSLVPSLWVMNRQLDLRLHFRGASFADLKDLSHVSFYMFLMQLSVVLANQIDTTILGYALPSPSTAISLYQTINKPFIQIRQTGWTLAYLVMPAVASLIAARDFRALERVKYDGTRLHIASLTPIAMLAWIYAGPFLTLWVGDKFGYDAAREAYLMRLFLIAVIPLILSVPVQIAFGMNKVEVIAISALVGSLINFPLSLYLTLKLGVSGVIWGTVVTTLFSNLLAPGYYVFRKLEYDGKRFLFRTLGPPFFGGLALLGVTTVAQAVSPLNPSVKGGMSLMRWLPLVWHLSAGCLAFFVGYVATPTGRDDALEIISKLRRRVTSSSS